MVGINNPSPSYTLDVNGSINTNNTLYSATLSNSGNMQVGGTLLSGVTTYSSNTSYYASNAATAASNKIFGYSFSDFPGYIMKRLDTSNNINILLYLGKHLLQIMHIKLC